MKKPKPRYGERREIIGVIEEVKRAAADKLTSALALENLAREQRKLAAQDEHKQEAAILIELAIGNEQKAGSCRIAATNLLEGKLAQLGEKLSEFMTMPLPGLLPDETVEAI